MDINIDIILADLKDDKVPRTQKFFARGSYLAYT